MTLFQVILQLLSKIVLVIGSCRPHFEGGLRLLAASPPSASVVCASWHLPVSALLSCGACFDALGGFLDFWEISFHPWMQVAGPHQSQYGLDRNVTTSAEAHYLVTPRFFKPRVSVFQLASRCRAPALRQRWAASHPRRRSREPNMPQVVQVTIAMRPIWRKRRRTRLRLYQARWPIRAGLKSPCPPPTSNQQIPSRKLRHAVTYDRMRCIEPREGGGCNV